LKQVGWNTLSANLGLLLLAAQKPEDTAEAVPSLVDNASQESISLKCSNSDV
jgi:hypothetical protein